MRKLSAILTGFLAIPGLALWLAVPANAARQRDDRHECPHIRWCSASPAPHGRPGTGQHTRRGQAACAVTPVTAQRPRAVRASIPISRAPINAASPAHTPPMPQ